MDDLVLGTGPARPTAQMGEIKTSTSPVNGLAQGSFVGALRADDQTLLEAAALRSRVEVTSTPKATIDTSQAHGVCAPLQTVATQESAQQNASSLSSYQASLIRRAQEILLQGKECLREDHARFDAIHERAKQKAELIQMIRDFKEATREKLCSIPLFGGVFESAFRVSDAVLEKIEQAFAKEVDELILIEALNVDTGNSFFLSPDKSATLITTLGQVQQGIEEEESLVIVQQVSPDTSLKKIAEAARRLCEDLIQELERIENEKKKHDAEEETKEQNGLSVEERVAKLLPGAGHDPRVAQMISSAFSGILQDYTEMELRGIVENILRAVADDSEKVSDMCV